MESHVNGPTTLGELRHSLLAVVGNPHFTPEEQLRANHSTHECDQPARLALWLRNVQREAARRDLVARAQELANQWSCVADQATMEADLLQVVKHPCLDADTARDLKWLFDHAWSDARRRQIVGAAYKMVLRHTGKLDEVRS